MKTNDLCEKQMGQLHTFSILVTFSAGDRAGHEIEVSSDHVIIDTTPPVIAYVAAGTVTAEDFVAGHELPVHWGGVEDRESGIKNILVINPLLFLLFACQSLT